MVDVHRQAHQHGVVLQRGRAPESAECHEQRDDGAPSEEPASTGPRSGERGVYDDGDVVHGLSVASTGPRSGERGVTDSISNTEALSLASTGPRSGERGVPAAAATSGERGLLQRGRAPESAEWAHGRGFLDANSGRFNGAALRRARSGERRGLCSGSETCFNGAALRRARSAPARSAGNKPSRSFNGAALRRARSETCGLQELALEQEASTGPRSGERGVHLLHARTLRNVSLQRGRAPESAEWCRSRNWAICANKASTGPRSGERGVANRCA